MTLNQEQIKNYQDNGYLVVNDIFSAEETNLAIEDAHKWQDEFMETITDDQKKWYIDGGTAVVNQVRKLDNPVFYRKVFQNLARNKNLVSTVESIIGKDVICFFSQLFFKPPQGGGPKPIHQDNFYFGPDQEDGAITAWVALEKATKENGCLHYCKGSHKSGVIDHFAPEGEPFNYQVANPERFKMEPAPVEKGGIALHHGITLHQSSDNQSNNWRRAVAMHFIQKDVKLVKPIFEYDSNLFVKTY